MNRPRRPSYPPPRRRPGGPPATHSGPPPPRRRTALDALPTDVEPRFKVLGSGVDRQTLMAGAEPLEMVVIQGFSREIEDAFHKFGGRPDEFWARKPEMIETARKLDEVLALIQERKSK